MGILKKIYWLCGILAVLGFASCSSGDGNEDNTPVEDLILRTTTVTEGQEVDAASVTTISLQYDKKVKISNASAITLNGENVQAKSSSVTSLIVDIAVSLEPGKSYTLVVPAGAIVNAEDANHIAKAFTLNFTTAKDMAADLPDNEAMEVTRMIGFGWNLGNHFDSDDTGNTSGNYRPSGYWDNATPTAALYTKLAAAGIKTVRIPVTWGPYENMTDGNYTIDATYMATVKQNVLWAKAAGLNVILNTHHDEYWLTAKAASFNSILNDSIKTRITATWKQIATAFKDEGSYLILETFNELNDNWQSPTTGELTIMNEWNQVAVDAIRSVGGENATRWISVPAYQASPTYALTDAFVLPTDAAKKLIVAVHSYDPYNFTIASTLADTWGHKSGSASDEKNITDMMYKLRTKFIEKNIPIYLGEIGCSRHTTDAANKCREYYFEYFCRAAYFNGLACCLWDNFNAGAGSEHHAYFNHNNGEWVDGHESLVKLMIKANTSTDSSYSLESIYNKAP